MIRLCLLTQAIVVVAAMAIGGCATSRSEVQLEPIPSTAAAAAPAATGRPIVIRSVTDERQFEQAPRDPSVPSLGFEGAGAASAETKARAIARKRNGYGGAMGDVLLQPGTTVEKVVREDLAAAFRSAGYAVVSDAAPGSTPLVVDVHIRKFWAWLTPGFWTVTLRANIETEFGLNEEPSPVKISVTAQDSTMAATDDEWIKVVQDALKIYRDRVVEQFASRKPGPPADRKPSDGAKAPANADLARRLEQLEELHKKGLISDAEYAEKRKAVLDQL